MTRFQHFLLSLVAAAAAVTCLLFTTGTAWAKYVPPPPPTPPKGHCVTTVGWLAPADVAKVDEAAEIIRIQTGFVLDILLAANDEPIDEITDETFKAWQPGDPARGNGMLLVLQPNFPKGQRKARLQVGKALAGRLTAAKATSILKDDIGPLLNGTDLIRAAVAGAVLEISKAVGADLSPPPPVDAGASTLAPAPVRDPVSPEASTSTSTPASSDGLGRTLAIVFGSFVGLLLAYVAYERFRPKGKGSGL
jgi:uncharacterized membrane protein YgcG